jgi:hypothetical protein
MVEDVERLRAKLEPTAFRELEIKVKPTLEFLFRSSEVDLQTVLNFPSVARRGVRAKVALYEA